MSSPLVAYSNYERSPFPWLGSYPCGWKLTRVKFESYVKARVGWHGLKSDDFTETGPFLVTGTDFKMNRIDWHACHHCDVARYDQDPYIQLRNGDLLVTKDGTIGKLAIVDDLDGLATLNSGIFVVRPLSSRYTSQFYFWLLESSVFNGFVDYRKTGSTIVHLYQETFEDFAFALPSPAEQIRIAQFLDYETARIDVLIEKQQRLIALLKEKRQAIISHAVTRGLNPNAPLRNSGNEWLAMVPAHWKSVSVRALMRSEALQIQDGNHGVDHPVASEYVDSGIPFLMACNVRSGSVSLSSCKFLSKQRADQLRIGFARPGDVLLTHKGTVGEVAMVPERIEADYWMLTPQVTYYRWKRPNLSARFFFYQFQSVQFQEQMSCIGEKQSTRSYVGILAQKALALAIPPIAEQHDIVAMLDNRVGRYDQLVAKIEASMLLLEERRTALISAAVTGKIDVRKWSPPDSNAEQDVA